jgi:hypothetical protein
MPNSRRRAYQPDDTEQAVWTVFFGRAEDTVPMDELLAPHTITIEPQVDDAKLVLAFLGEASSVAINRDGEDPSHPPTQPTPSPDPGHPTTADQEWLDLLDQI